MTVRSLKTEAVNIKDAFEKFEHFCKAMLDAYAVVNKEGRVIKCNQQFSTLVGKKSRQILKEGSFDELLTLTIAGQTISIEEILKQKTPTRIDEVRGSAEGSPELNLILGIYPFVEANDTIGSFILIRDVTAETNLQDKYKVKATQSITDKLTGLYNRTYFEHYLATTLNSLAQKGESHKISVIMADIDHFKAVNDTHGHQAGDFILEVVAKIFRENFRKTDILCRYGGEEFLAILPSTDLGGASMAAEKLREAVAAYSYVFNKTTIPVTISLGLAEVDIATDSGETAIARADAALYHAKKNGRNRVSTHKGNKIE
ncbi:MAG: sensor domain-containing diguanylate cyclase [Oligoflexales bacterium]|nr:sensor domain-containing diguanylate cyclase [Oligoflexales bacterium]